MECSKVIELDLGDAEHSAARIGTFAPGDGSDSVYPYRAPTRSRLKLTAGEKSSTPVVDE